MFKKRIEAKIKKKQEERAQVEREIQDLKAKLGAIDAYIEACEENIKMLPADPASSEAQDVAIRKGSLADRARDVLKEEGKPMRLRDILKAMGEPKDRRQAVSGTLASYVRKGQIFTRPMPGTFGLIEFKNGAHGKVGEVIAGAIAEENEDVY